jgi:hypothetical protein
MPLPGLQSLLDEVLIGGQAVFQCYRSMQRFLPPPHIIGSIIATSPISPPLREMIYLLVRTEFHELSGFIENIRSGQFETSKM